MATVATDGGGWLTVPETAELLKLSKITIYRRVYDGVLPAVKVGTAVRIPAAALVELLQRSLVGSPAGALPPGDPANPDVR